MRGEKGIQLLGTGRQALVDVLRHAFAFSGVRMIIAFHLMLGLVPNRSISRIARPRKARKLPMVFGSPRLWVDGGQMGLVPAGLGGEIARPQGLDDGA